MMRAVEPMFMPRVPAYLARPKLTPAQRDEIAYLRGDGRSIASLAREYGVSCSVVACMAPRERP